MEIEAKFAVPNQETFQRLQALVDLCGYELCAPQVREVHDTYLDTAERQVLATGHFCRRRESPQGILITLKALAPPADRYSAPLRRGAGNGGGSNPDSGRYRRSSVRSTCGTSPLSISTRASGSGSSSASRATESLSRPLRGEP